MKQSIQILMIAMSAAVCSAQNSSDVEQIMKDLQAAKPAKAVASANEVAPPSSMPALPPQEAPQKPLTDAEAETLADESMRQYANGNYAAASKGFAAVLRSKPDHAIARYFQSRIDTKHVRNTEEAAMGSVDQAWNGMILRNYPLSDEAIAKLKLSDSKQSVDVADLFSPVPFEAGAYAVYRPNVKKIMVLNTSDRVSEMEALLTTLEMPIDGKEGQIEIKTRFVEFAEGALEELGFKWSDVTDGQSVASADDWSVKDGENLFGDSLRSSGTVFTQPQNIGGAGSEERVAGDWTASRLQDGFSDTAGELRITGDIGPKVEMLIRALDQTSGADVLSAPSVVTRAGQKASIQVGQTHYFPSDFGVGGSEGTIVHVSYNDFSEKLMGVDLSVTPKLIKNDLIEMDLNPKVIELLGWRNYQIAPADSAYTFYQFRIGNTYQHDPVIARLPIFRHREVKTKVTIQDGSTIGMGGLISEKTESFSDRVPVLGSIPLVGRLFRSEGDRTVKRNLMIFVTASMVSPNGRMVGESVAK